MTRLYLSKLISLVAVVNDHSYAQISPESDLLPTLSFATSPPHTSTARFKTSHIIVCDVVPHLPDR